MLVCLSSGVSLVIQVGELTAVAVELEADDDEPQADKGWSKELESAKDV